MTQLTDKRIFIALSSLATPDAPEPSHHEREKKPIGRRYRSIPSYAGKSIRRSRPRISVIVLPGAAGLSHGRSCLMTTSGCLVESRLFVQVKACAFVPAGHW